MSNHHIRYVGYENEWQAKCTCRSRSPFGPKALCEEWKWQHLQDVQRARATLANGLPLRRLVAYYQEQAANASNPRTERDLWQRLADELETRVADPVDEDQLELW